MIQNEQLCLYIHFLLDSKKVAEKKLEKEVGLVGDVEEVDTVEQDESHETAKRSRKRKSYGEDFEEVEEQITSEESEGISYLIVNTVDLKLIAIGSLAVC